MRVATGQIRRGVRFEAHHVDVTVKSAKTPIGRLLAPTWDLVMGLKEDRLTVDGYRAGYRRLLHERFNRGASLHRSMLEAWMRETDYVVLLCYCTPGTFCHRRLLSDEILPRVATYLDVDYESCGELAHGYVVS